ncbi:PIN domain-containing protein [Nostocoides sp. F2B08]|uniref:type II toxin-antitoxin system VapC family toxin n=1 Tax=Nostocoides sp. F2B08 TaxID=2653936 RepID=UPI001262C1BE|nr:PIN domain-containing protein [Tetrasphaera sp. F2B08]KAB7744842.1 PIN domain-containing protein [Tetrasphaera sp. F2B08]
MPLLVDTSVWSLAYRRDTPPDVPEVDVLRRTLTGDGSVVTTGMILLELLRGFVPARAQETIRAAFDSLAFIDPTHEDYVEAATVANSCSRVGVQLGSVDALIAQLAMAGGHTLLTTDKDFHLASRHIGLRVWRPPG